jgi:hypothetical protein
VGWYIALALEGSTRPVKLAEAFVIANDETDEVREVLGGLNGLLSSWEEGAARLRRIAGVLGRDVQRRWDDGDRSLDLAAEVQAALLRNLRIAEALNAPPWVPPPDGATPTTTAGDGADELDLVPDPESGRAW